jgi:hypothetical protein
MDNAATEDPQAFIFSTIGSWPAGIGLGLLFAGIKWWEKTNKNWQNLKKKNQDMAARQGRRNNNNRPHFWISRRQNF